MSQLYCNFPKLTNEQRTTIADYFHVYKMGNENSNQKVSLMGPALHPFLGRSSEFIRNLFEEEFLSTQNLFSTEDRFEKILKMIPNESITSELRGKWQENRRSSNSKENINVVRWKQLEHMLQSGALKRLCSLIHTQDLIWRFQKT